MRRTASTAFSLRTLTTWSAPSSRPICRRLSRVPVRITGDAPSALATATPSRPIGPGPVTTTLSPATSPPNSVSPYIAVPGHDQRRLLVRHGVGNGDQRVDIVHLVFA